MKGKRLLILGAAFALGLSACASATRVFRTNPLKEGESEAYTIEFANNTSSATAISSTTNASTVIAESGRSYVATKPFTVNSGNIYYGDTKTCIRLGKSGNASSLTIALNTSYNYTNSGKQYSSISVNCDKMSGNKNVNAKLSVNGSDFQDTPANGSPDDVVFTLSNTAIDSIVLAGDAAIFVHSITLTTTQSSSGPSFGTLDRIEIDEPADILKFSVGETFSSEGLVLTGYDEDDNTQTYSSGFTTNYDNHEFVESDIGNNKTVTVTYGGKTTTYSIDVGAPLEKTVSEAYAIANALESGKTADELYVVEGYITSITTAWNTTYNNITYKLGEEIGASSNLLTIYRTGVEGGKGPDLEVGDQVSVIGKLYKYNTTPQMINGSTTYLSSPATIENYNDVDSIDAVSTPKTVAEINAYTQADNSLIAKVTGVAESISNTKYGNFDLIDPNTGKKVLVYGGYSDATFQKIGNAYSTNTKTTPVTDSIIGHAITVYSIVGYYGSASQLVDALVNDSGEQATVRASINYDDSMGSATLSATSMAYGSEVVVTPVPADGYKVSSVTVERMSATDTLVAESDGTYKFTAKAKNVVTVTFAADESTVLVSVAKYNFVNSKGDSTSDVNVIKGWFNLLSGTNILDSVSEPTKVAPGANGGSTQSGNTWESDNLLKIGTASAAGSLTFNLSQEVGKVVITGYAWKNTLSLTVGSETINSALVDNLANKENVEAGNTGKVTAIINPSDEITISTTNTSVVIVSIEFFKETATKDAIADLFTRSALSYSYTAEEVDGNTEFTYSNVVIRYGGFLSKEYWDSLKGIQGYGIIAAVASELNGDTILDLYNEAINDGEDVYGAIESCVCDGENIRNFYTPLTASKTNPAQASQNQITEQGGDTNEVYYVWNLKKNIALNDLTTAYSAVAYIRLANEVIFFSEVSVSAADCADRLIASGAYTAESLDGSLDHLAGLN